MMEPHEASLIELRDEANRLLAPLSSREQVKALLTSLNLCNGSPNIYTARLQRLARLVEALAYIRGILP